MKYYLRVASKVTTPIDEIFGGVKLNTVICRECRSPSQTLEPFFDISLGVIKDMQNKDFSKANYWQQQHQHQSRQTRSNTASGGGSSKHPPMWDPKKAHKINYDAKSAQDLLVKKKMPYLPTRDNHESDIASGLERSLTDHTAIDNMDEDNKFICQQCTNRKGDGKGSGGGSDDDVVLCLVAKQIIIHKLPKVLILHIKRFNIGDYMVKKDSTHITFPPILNMAPYCSNTCLEECCDANNNIFYGLYAVVEHKGVTLKSGHYVAYVRRRPLRDPKQYDYHGEYDQGAAHDGKWLYTSDEVIRESQWDDVKNCDAYLLFYELLPRKKSSV
ncbi:ubiquitin carboxyl-terminal hydrolase 45-like [Dysidea avara]|uniref:ubiquitin carboxyl-terminal hydrolase 45-like n=1 Tax=Dysidea avara TaxID=196820 RepID=UPI00331BABC8